ncbi:hypothetical protein [Methanomassiliicoccus luminyensis]|uniref:hypothetical protein n=1 Tax=Methanomassiliicoccus luminyensis TaxID=1080712 RepID=UPI0003739AA0|nr:hypothetical protein [Methanomassiliicoccus luminyensis]
MSQDGKTFKDNAINGQSLGVVSIAVGFAILIGAYLIRDNIWLIIPVVMLEVGIYGMAIALSPQMRGSSTSGRWGNDSTYTMFWSSMVIVVGIMWIIYDQLKDANLIPAFIAVFLFYFGITVMMLNRNKTTRTRVW